MDIPDELLVHTVSVETYDGTNSYGDTFAPPTNVPCFVDDQRKLVLSPDGAQVVSEATVLAKLDKTSTFTPKSRVTLPDGRSSIVINAKRRDDGDMGAPQHVEVVCT